MKALQIVPRLVALLLIGYPVGVGVQERSVQETISGSHPSLGITYSAELYSDGIVVVDLSLNRSRFLARINYREETFSLRSFSASTGQAARMTKKDRDDIYRMYAVLPSGSSLVNDAAVSVLNLLAEHPLDQVVLDLRTDRQARWTSLCASIGRRVTGRYTIGRRVITEGAVCGPCGSGPCLGRCGPGCGAPPNTAVQAFTQECLNHDLCAGATGRNLGECADEWRAAAPGFLFATDCARLTGTWRDNFGYVWTLSEGSDRLILGSVNTGRCGTWNVSGRRSSFRTTLTARIRRRQTGCATSFTYNGNHHCNTGSGTWTNSAGRRGTWTMTRQTFADGTEPKPEPSLPDPEEEDGISSDPFRLAAPGPEAS